jgi:hypothetical protein
MATGRERRFLFIHGAIFLFRPGIGVKTLAFYIGNYPIIFGALLIALGFKLRIWEMAGGEPVSRFV